MRRTFATLLLVWLLGAPPVLAGDQIFVFVDENGVVHARDRRDDPRARLWSPGAFEKWALGQEATPHRGHVPVSSSRTRSTSKQRAPLVSKPTPFDAMISEAAARYGVRPALVRAVVMVESAFKPDAVSRAGAGGLMQLMPATARDLGVDDVFDPASNVDGGTRYLAGLLRMFNDESLALAAYNAGPGRVARAGRRIPRIPETEAYVRAVLALAGEIEESRAGAP
jgi:soluble lytic murein transglycosylase-like protein